MVDEPKIAKSEEAKATKEATKEEKNEEIRKLTKKGDNNYFLEIERPFYKIHHTQVFTKEGLKEIYVDVKKTIDGMTLRQKELQKQLKAIDMDDTELEELKVLLKKLEKVANIKKKEQLENQIGVLTKEIEKSHKQAIEITAVIPELLRNK